MLDKIYQFLAKTDASKTTESLNEQSERVQIAVCALLLEIAEIDGQFSESEKKKILDILQNHYGLNPDYARELTHLAEKEKEESLDLWQFTNLINENFTEEEKFDLVRTLWQVVYTDGALDKYEDYLIHKLGNLLNLTHRELIKAKLEVLEKQKGNQLSDKTSKADD